MNSFTTLLVKVIRNKFNAKVLNVLMRYVRDNDTARDIINQAVLNLLKEHGSLSDDLNKYQTEESVQNLIMRVAINLAIDHYRKNRNWKLSIWDESLHQISGNQFSLESRVKDENLERLWQSYSKGNLTSDERKLFYLIAEGYDRCELTDIFGITKGTLNTRISRMREKISKFLALHGIE